MSHYNLETTIRALLRLLKEETGEQIQVVAHSDAYVIDINQGIVLEDFEATDRTGHRKWLDLYSIDRDENQYSRIPHPSVYDLSFNITPFSNLFAGIWRLQENILRFFKKRRYLEVNFTEGEGEEEEIIATFNHRMYLTAPFRSNFRPNFSNLRQLQGGAVIENVPIYTEGEETTGALIQQVLIRIKEESLDEEDLGELDLIRVPATPETEWEE